MNSYTGQVISGGVTLGTGFAVHESGLIATSFHVVRSVASSLAGMILQFRFVESNQLIKVAVTSKYDERHDVILLQAIGGGLPIGTGVARLIRSSTASPGAEIEFLGFGNLNDVGHKYEYLSGIGQFIGVSLRDDVPILQAQSRHVLKGMSGSPLVVRALGGVIGMISARYSVEPGHTWMRDTVWAIPAEYIASLDIDRLELHEPVHVGVKRVPYSRVLLPDSAIVFRPLRDKDGGRLHASDGSILQFMMEELIRLGVVDIAIGGRSPLSNVVGSLPDPFRKRVVVVDTDEACINESKAIMRPVWEEFRIKVGAKLEVFRHNDSLPMSLNLAIISLSDDIYRYLTALKYQLQMDADIDGMKKAVREILAASRDPLSRANLVTLEGILRTYEPHTLEGITLKSTAPDRLTAVFERFVREQNYRQFSAHTRSLGYPEQFAIYVQRITDGARKVVSSPNLKALVKASRRSLLASRHLPEVQSELFQDVLQAKYLPTIVSLGGAVQKAKTTWRSVKPSYLDPRPPAEVDNSLEGLQDDWDAEKRFLDQDGE